ncbi:MAG TPA: hypothetical protein VN851_24750, partial [Thermoanaerobaculia bacterium]|nr:hypothetical protein [Thermoanaerobaculia bacterium]
MADTLIIVSDSGKVYRVTLGDPSQSVELKPDDPLALGAKRKAAEGVLIAEINPDMEKKSAPAGEIGIMIIMGTFVNLPMLGGD